MNHHSRSDIKFDSCPQLECSLIFLHREKIREISTKPRFTSLTLNREMANVGKKMVLPSKSSSQRQLHSSGLLSNCLSFCPLSHLSVMLLDTTETTSELGWTTYPDTGVSRVLTVNVRSSCWSVNAALLEGILPIYN